MTASSRLVWRFAVLALLTTFTAGCGVEGVRGVPSHVATVSNCDTLRSFDVLSDLEDADALAVAQVQREIVRRHDPSSEGYTDSEREDLGIRAIYTREVELAVEEVVVGVNLTREPFRVQDARREERAGNDNRWQICGQSWLEEGDRVLIALDVSARDGRTPIVYTSDSVFFLRGGQVVDTDRTNPTIRQLERLSEVELVAMLRQELG